MTIRGRTKIMTSMSSVDINYHTDWSDFFANVDDLTQSIVEKRAAREVMKIQAREAGEAAENPRNKETTKIPKIQEINILTHFYK